MRFPDSHLFWIPPEILEQFTVLREFFISKWLTNWLLFLDRIQNTKRDKLDPQFIDSMKNWNGPETDIESKSFKVGKSQLAAIHRFLVAEVNPFSSQMLNDHQIKNMLSRNDSIVTLKRNDTSLINRHDQINSFMMIISGRAEIYFSSGLALLYF